MRCDKNDKNERIKTYYKNNTATVAIGNIKNETNITSSIANKTIRIARSAMMKNDFTTIPIALEKPTNPCRYSFLSGLKNVLNNRGRENSWKKASLKEAKNLSSATGLSINQNFRNITGRLR